MRGAVFLDRDGVLNELVERDGKWVSPRKLTEFRVVPGAARAVRRLRDLGYRVLVVTNQPDVARGFLAEASLQEMHWALANAVAFDDIAVCPHDDADRCRCRKPAPGMLEELAARWAIDLSSSIMVGDSWRDIEAGRRAGCQTVLITGGEARDAGGDADALVGSLDSAVAWIAGSNAS